MFLGIFEIGLHFRNWHVFMWQSLETWNVFNTLTLRQIFQTFFKKLECRFVVESTKINISTLTKLSYQKTNVKTDRMGSTKWTYRKKRSFIWWWFVPAIIFKSVLADKTTILINIKTSRKCGNSIYAIWEVLDLINLEIEPMKKFWCTRKRVKVIE